MRKVISLVLALTLVFALCVPAFAADTIYCIKGKDTTPLPPENPKDSIIYTKTTKDVHEDPEDPTSPIIEETVERFFVRFPAETEIPWNAPQTVIPYWVYTQFTFGRHLEVSIRVKAPKGNDPLAGTLKHDDNGTSYELPYMLTGASFIASAPNVHDTGADPIPIVNEDGEQENIYFKQIDELTVNIAERDWAAAIVGRYEDTLTFTATVVPEGPITP